jgi:hypothetical protein
MKRSILPWVRKQGRVLAFFGILAGVMSLSACATVPAGTSSANTALATERAAIADSCITAGNFGPVLANMNQNGIFTAATWLKIKDTYVTLHPICHPVGGTPNLSNYATVSLTVAQSVATLAQYATTTKQISSKTGAL